MARGGVRGVSCASLGCPLLKSGTATEAVGERLVTKYHFAFSVTPNGVSAQLLIAIPTETSRFFVFGRFVVGFLTKLLHTSYFTLTQAWSYRYQTETEQSNYSASSPVLIREGQASSRRFVGLRAERSPHPSRRGRSWHV